MFKVALTRDFLTPEGALTYENIGLDILDEAGITYEFLDEYRSPVTADMLRGYQAVISLAPAYDRESFKGLTGLQAICRFGVGYDMVDLGACSNANVLVTITRGAVNYSVAEAVITWMLALSHRLIEKNRLVRSGNWAQRSNYMGSELRGRTLGIIGLGGIGCKLVELLAPFGMKQTLAFDPYVKPDLASAYGVQLVGLHQLLSSSDFISINCPLNDETRNLIGAEQLAMVREHAFIINTARGGIIDEAALVDALKTDAIGGYATDVFEQEPADGSSELCSLDNVILAPHCIAWTEELFSEIGRMACRQVVQIARGELPDDIVNRDILPGYKPNTL